MEWGIKSRWQWRQILLPLTIPILASREIELRIQLSTLISALSLSQKYEKFWKFQTMQCLSCQMVDKSSLLIIIMKSTSSLSSYCSALQNDLYRSLNALFGLRGTADFQKVIFNRKNTIKWMFMIVSSVELFFLCIQNQLFIKIGNLEFYGRLFAYMLVFVGVHTHTHSLVFFYFSSFDI